MLSITVNSSRVDITRRLCAGYSVGSTVRYLPTPTNAIPESFELGGWSAKVTIPRVSRLGKVFVERIQDHHAEMTCSFVWTDSTELIMVIKEAGSQIRSTHAHERYLCSNII